MNYPYFQTTQNYLQDLQQMKDRIDNQMRQIQQQSIQPTPITQNFQIAPTNNNLKFVNSIDDVQKDIVIADTYFISNDFNNMWLKNTNGNVRTFAIQEIKPKDEKDIMIENLQKQIDELKGGSTDEYAKSDDGTISTTKSTNVQSTKSSKTK